MNRKRCLHAVMIAALLVPAARAAVPADALAPEAAPSVAPDVDASAVAERRDDSFERDRIARRSAWLLGGSVGAVYLFGLTSWWGDGFERDFKSRPEGWFGSDTDHGGQDKLGHFMFTYAGTRLATWGLQSFGNDPATALKLSTVTMFGALTGVEVIDGFAKRWSFSREDALMNLAGAAAAVVMETRPGIDRVVDLRIHYLPSRLADGSRRQWAPFSDYEGQTYYVVAKASGIDALARIPIVKYLEASIGYGARGFEVGGDRTRISYVGVSLDLGRLFGDTLLKDAGPKTRKVSDNLFEYVQFQSTGAWGERRF
ncbi:MAG: YfiM family protein [Burkholderiales bacterium]|jgi:hypothetical protein|nr:YfiM family protein [Burkholderiales bacterium]